MSDLINLEVHEVVYRDESGAFLAGYACATHKSILSTIFTHHSNEFVKVHKSLYEEDPPPGHCCFVPKKIERNLNEEAFILSMTDESLYVTARHAAKYAVISGSTDSKLWSGTKRTRSMSSMSSGSTANDSICEKSMQTPATALGKASVVGNGDGIVTEIKAAGTSSSRSTQSKPYKTPNAVVTTQPNISAKDKAAVQFNIPERKGVLASTIPWKAPVPNSSIVGEGKLSEEIIMQSIYNLKRSCKWSVHYGEKAHLKPIENQVFVIPYGRYSEKSTSRGFENIEYFTEKSHFVAHIQRNPSITYDFKNVWSKLEKQGWQRDSPSSSSGSDFRIRFPAATTVNTSLMPRTVDGSPIQNVKGIHNFNSQAALHLYIMKFPYPLQEDAVLVDTLKGMGWTCQTSQPGCFCHPLFPVHKSASLQEVRHLLWTDPSLLAARAYKNVSVSAQIDVSSCLRAAFKILDEANLVDPAEVEEGSDFDDKSVRDILAIVEKHIGTETEMNAKSGGVWWQFSKEEIEELESLLVNGCGWRIEKHGSPESSDWWKHFKAYFPDFDGLIPTGSPSSRRKGQRKSYIPGVSIFWCLDDVLKYLQTYGNVSPVNVDSVLPNLRVNLAASPQPDYKSIISSETFDLVSDFHSIFYTLLDENWSMVMIKPTSVKELYPTLKNEEEITCVFAASWVKGLSPDGMFDPKSHVKDRDFFIFKESVINYLKRFGNFYVSASKFNKATGDGNKICGNRARQYQLISSDDACTEFVTFVGETCEIRAKNEINHLLSDELGVRHVTARVIELLEDIGWRNTWGTDNYKNFNADNIFFAPWVQKEIPAASEMTLNVDYFMRQKDVIDFVKRHGFNKPTSSAQKASSKRSTKVAIDLIPAAPKSIVVPNEVKVNTKSASKSPTRKLKKGVIPTRPSTIKQVAVNSTPPGRTMSESEKELREIIESPSGNYKCRRIMDTLLEMGWREGVKANFAKYHSEYIILPPWGSVHFDFESEGRESVFPMVSNVHFFNNIKDVEVYVVKYGNQESEAAALEEVHGRRRRSQKPAVPSTTKKTLNIKSLKAPKRKLPKEDDVDKMEVEASEEHASVEESSEEGEEESSDSEEEEDKDEEEDYVDPYPALSDSGEEGSLKEALIANPTKYPTEVMRPFLEEWGWMLQVKADASLYFKDYIILAPWATNQFSYEEFGKASILTLVHGADYFREISEARDYVLMHGNREMAEDEKVALLNDSGRRKRSTAPQPAPVTTTAVVKGKSKAKRESSKTGNKRSQPEKIKNKSPISSKRSKKKDMCTDSIDNKAPSADCNEEEFSYTQSIKLFEAECSEQADEPLPEVDNDCSTEIIEIVRASLKDRPRLNPSSFKCVMSVLRVYGWSYLYSNSVGASEIYHRPRLSIKKSNLSEFKEGRDYFQSQEDVLEFVKNQILARKGNYDNIAEKAIFCPDDDFADDDDDLLEAVADEDHIKLKLPTGSLYQSSEPYVSSFDALTSHDAVGDDNEEEEEEDDIPIGVFGNVDEADDSYIADAEICDGKEVVVDSSTSDTQALGDDDDFFSYSCTADVLDGDSLSSTLTQIESQTQAQVESFKDIEIEAEQSQSIMSPSPVDKCESLESTSVGQKRKLSPIKNQRVLATNEASPLSKKVRSPKRASIAIIPGSSISNSKSKPASLNRGVTVSPNALRFRSNSVSRNPSPNSDKGYIPTNKPHTSPKKASPSVEASPSKVSTSHLRISTGPINSVPASSILPLNVVLTRVKARLQASYTPAKVLHREAEYEKIRDATKGSLLAGQGTTILVAGQPGQGKTLCVKHVISSLTGDTEVEQFSKLFLKGSDFSGGFKFLAKELGIEGLYSEVAAENAVKEYFCVSNKSRDVERLLLVIDEIDMVPSSFRQSLLTLTKTDSRVVLIGLANDLSTETYNTEVVFEVYTESQILDILKSLTENLFDDKGATMIAKTCTAEGDIRPVTTLALTCLELVQSQLALSETGKEELVKPAYPVVTLRIASLAKSQCRGLDMKDKLQSISKGAVLTLVSLALQYHVGDIFSFSEIVDLSNTHLEALKLQRCTGAEVEGHTQELLNNCFMHEVHSSKKQASSPHNAKFTLGINATDLLQENCRSILFAQNWNELEQSIKIRNA